MIFFYDNYLPRTSTLLYGLRDKYFGTFNVRIHERSAQTSVKVYLLSGALSNSKQDLGRYGHEAIWAGKPVDYGFTIY